MYVTHLRPRKVYAGTKVSRTGCYSRAFETTLSSLAYGICIITGPVILIYQLHMVMVPTSEQTLQAKYHLFYYLYLWTPALECAASERDAVSRYEYL
jgi:hypothetical protein